MKYRKKPVVIEATQWFENGDHPGDESVVCRDSHGEEYLTEGKVVRRFRDPNVLGKSLCGFSQCQKTMHEHGWIDTLEGGHIVCPGDWIITGIQGEHYPCKPDIFEATYDLVQED
jgi:hypothetical protein